MKIILVLIILLPYYVYTENSEVAQDSLFVYYSVEAIEYRDNLEFIKSIEFSEKGLMIDSLNKVFPLIISDNLSMLNKPKESLFYLNKAFSNSTTDKIEHGFLVKGHNPPPIFYLRRITLNEKLGNLEDVTTDVLYLQNTDLRFTDLEVFLLNLYYVRQNQQYESNELLQQLSDDSSIHLKLFCKFYEILLKESYIKVTDYWGKNQIPFIEHKDLFEFKKVLFDLKTFVSFNDFEKNLILSLILNEMDYHDLSLDYLHNSKELISNNGFDIKSAVSKMEISDNIKMSLLDLLNSK